MKPVDALIEQLAGNARPVRPLAPPLTRASAMLAGVAVAGGVIIFLFGDLSPLLTRNAGRELLMAGELIAMLATGILAVTGAYFTSVPGRARHWMWLALPPFLLWLLLSGTGCYGELIRNGAGGWELGHSFDCLLFILGVSVALGVPLIWLLSRAAPIYPLPVSMLGGLGVAAIAAFLLQFFHPFAVTFLDLGVHLLAILLVVAVTGLLQRRAMPGA